MPENLARRPDRPRRVGCALTDDRQNDSYLRCRLQGVSLLASLMSSLASQDPSKAECHRVCRIHGGSCIFSPEISLIFAHEVGSRKQLWDVLCPSPTGEPFGPRGGVVPLACMLVVPVAYASGITSANPANISPPVELRACPPHPLRFDPHGRQAQCGFRRSGATYQPDRLRRHRWPTAR